MKIKALGLSGTAAGTERALNEITVVSVALLALNVLFFALQVHLNNVAVLSQRGAPYPLAPGGGFVGPADMLRLPYPAIFHEIEPSEKYHVFLIVLALVQTATLYGLRSFLSKALDQPLVRLALLISGIVMIWQAVGATSLASLDMYAYVGYAKLGFAHAYSPNGEPFPGEFAAINQLWGRPMLPCYYGPVWLGLEQVVAGSATTLGKAILLTRLLGLAALAFLTFALYRYKVSQYILVLLVLNPAVLGLCVVNGHNDVLGVAFAMCALAVVASAPLLASLLIACAALVKLPLLGLSLAIFTKPQPLQRRLFFIGLAVMVVAVASALAGGATYLRNLAFHAGHLTSHEWKSETLSHILTAIAVLVLAVVFVRGIVFQAGSWTLFMLNWVNIYPWYLVWGLPYASRATPALEHFLIGLPIAAALLEYAYPSLHYRQYTMVAMILYVLYDLIRGRTRGIAVRPLSYRTR